MTASAFLSVEEIKSRRGLAAELAFPDKNADYGLLVLEELDRVGVEGIYFSQVGEFFEPVFLGKGYRGIVVRGRLKGGDVAVKILRSDSGLRSLSREAEATKLANEVGVGPKLFGYSDHVLVLELIEGEAFEDWLKSLKLGETRVLRNVLSEVFSQARALDRIGLDHGELSDAKKHVMIRGSSPVIIDFGKAAKRRKPSNVTSLFSYIAYGPYSGKISQMLGIASPPLEEVRAYKRELSDESFRALLKAMNLYSDEVDRA